MRFSAKKDQRGQCLQFLSFTTKGTTVRRESHNHKMRHFKTSVHFLKHFSNQTRVHDAGPMACVLKTRSVIRFRGPDTVKFLQGLVTKDVRRLEDPQPIGKNSATPNMPVTTVLPLYAALLTPQGRFLYDFFLYRLPRSDEKLDRTGSGSGPNPGELEIYADVDKSILDEVLINLKKYRLRSKVDIENMGEDFSCWQRFGSKIAGKSSPSDASESESHSVRWGGTVDPSGVLVSQGNSSGWQWNKDPRLDCLGDRSIFPSNTTRDVLVVAPMVEADEETDEENFLLWRLEKGVAEGSTEIPKGEAIPLEYNLTGLNAISFDKGCYVGQELIARTHHRGVIRKRLIPLRFLDDTGKEVDQQVSPGSEVNDKTSGKKVGTVTTALGARGMGLLRLDKAFKEMSMLTIKGQEDIKVESIRPEWWPAEWLLDHHQLSEAA